MALLALLGCAHPTAPAAQANIPADLRQVIANVESFGAKIHLYRGILALIAHKTLAEKIPPLAQQGLEGHVIVREAAGQGAPPPPIWNVLFFTTGPMPRIRYRVRVGLVGEELPQLQELQPAAEPTPEALALINARRNALAAVSDRTQPVTVVALIEKDGILVYLLADTNNPDVAVLGQHHRIIVSADGQKVLRAEALSTGPLEVALRSAEQPQTRLTELHVKETLYVHPTEVHVAASSLHKLPILVDTSRGRWRVDGTNVSLVTASP